MSYAIIKIIYGVAIDEGLRDKFNEIEDRDEVCNDVADSFGFTTLYSANGSYSPGYCGVELCEFNEASDPIRISTIKLNPTPQQKAEAEMKYDMLPDEIKEMTGKPDVYLVWYSS